LELTVCGWNGVERRDVSVRPKGDIMTGRRMKTGCHSLQQIAISFLVGASLCAAQEPESPTFQTTVFGTTVFAPGGLEGKIYFIPEVYKLPNLTKLKPVGTLYTKSLNVPLTEFRDGFPGITNRFEWFAIEYTGKFFVSEAGKYNFRLMSDDGSKLFIDGKRIIDIDALGTFWAAKSTNLTVGLHDLRIDYFQGPRYHLALIFEVQRPGAKRFQIFNTDDFRPPSDSPTPVLLTDTDRVSIASRPPLAQRQNLIQLAAEKATTYTSQLPDFLCTELVDRTENLSNGGWTPRDVLSIQLSYTNHTEHYQLVAVNNRPTDSTYESIEGATSGGEFGSLIAEIFQPHAASFDWLDAETLGNRTAFVFKYAISREKSRYSIRYRASATEVNRIVVGHHGLVYIDPDNGAVMRLIRIADLPDGVPIRNASTTLDYSLRDVGGRMYLLPFVAETELSTSVIQTHNHAEFLDYRKFDVDANIRVKEE